MKLFPQTPPMPSPQPPKRALVIVLDSVGCGNAPDAADFGDHGANTLGHLFERIPGLNLPHLASLGLDQVIASPLPAAPHHPAAQSTRLTSHAAGKDTTSGHWELMGCVPKEPFAFFQSFPATFIRELEDRASVTFIGNFAASGTEI
ncbi:MAG: hypothetical protein ACQCXQ_12915, partial [Verrucomicrobiales bacterium]